MRKSKWIKAALLLAGVMVLSSCGTIDNGTTTEQVTEQMSTGGKSGNDKSTEGTTEQTTEAFTAEEEETIIRRAKYADAVVMFYYANVWPDGTPIEGFDWDTMHENKFAIYDIDGDGIEELILSYTQTSIAGMREEIFQYDIATGELRSELSEYPGTTYFSNGYVEVVWAHNQGVTTDMWPFNVYQYNADTDNYDYVASVDSWRKKDFPEDYDGTPFPDEYDLDGNGDIYYISTVGDGRKPVDDAEFEAWRNNIEQGTSVLTVPYGSDEDGGFETLLGYTQEYKQLYYQKYIHTYGESAGDIGLRYFLDDSVYVGDLKPELENRYGITFTPENEYGDSEIGTVNNQTPIAMNYMNATLLIYQDTKVDDLTIFGIYPGMSEKEAKEHLAVAGFYEIEENGYITGDNTNNVGIWLDTEGGIVKKLSIRTYCSYAG